MPSRRSFLAALAVGLAGFARLPGRRRVGVGTFQTDPVSIAALKRLGITQTRITLYWQGWDGPDGTNTKSFLSSVDTLRAAGIEPLVVVHSPPVGLSLDQGIAQMPAFMAARAAERKGLVWQIMNEMDGNDGFNDGWFSAKNPLVTQATRGDRYGQLLGPVYSAVKAADPRATVVTGGIALEPTAFFAGLRRRAPGKYDAVAVHCYGDPPLGQFVAKSKAMRAVLGRVPLWCTETGSFRTDEAGQAAAIGAILDDNDRNNRYDRVYLYQLISDGDHYGIARSDGTLRQAAQLLAGRTAP
jgi:hypothetical protein